MAKKGDWVQVRTVVLKAEERTARIRMDKRYFAGKFCRDRR